jgi:hypothetical protein
LKRIEAVLDDADEKQNTERAVKDWLDGGLSQILIIDGLSHACCYFLLYLLLQKS